ncbi:hypothetical protein BASA81_003856 [Batrachochytrium salamandrivorans]|nr:hypothetical protein BASA81_003856 [Batrachochytrium salamandrivorans]
MKLPVLVLTPRSAPAAQQGALSVPRQPRRPSARPSLALRYAKVAHRNSTPELLLPAPVVRDRYSTPSRPRPLDPSLFASSACLLGDELVSPNSCAKPRHDRIQVRLNFDNL